MPIIDYLKNEIQMSIPIVFDVVIKFDQAGMFGRGFNIWKGKRENCKHQMKINCLAWWLPVFRYRHNPSQNRKALLLYAVQRSKELPPSDAHQEKIEKWWTLWKDWKTDGSSTMPKMGLQLFEDLLATIRHHKLKRNDKKNSYVFTIASISQ